MKMALYSLIFLTVLITLRIIIGPSIWDRILGLNLITTKFIMVIVLIAFMRQQTYFLDIAIVYALLGFIGITFISIAIQNRGGL